MSLHPLLIRTHILVVLTVVMYKVSNLEYHTVFLMPRCRAHDTTPLSQLHPRKVTLLCTYVLTLDFYFDQRKFRGPFSARSYVLGRGRVSSLLGDLIGVAKLHTEFILNVNEKIREKS